MIRMDLNSMIVVSLDALGHGQRELTRIFACLWKTPVDLIIYQHEHLPLRFGAKQLKRGFRV